MAGRESFNLGQDGAGKALTWDGKVLTRGGKVLTPQILTSVLGQNFIDLGQGNEGARPEPEVRTMHRTPLLQLIERLQFAADRF